VQVKQVRTECRVCGAAYTETKYISSYKGPNYYVIKSVVEEAKQLIKENLLNKGVKDFENLSENQRNFLFTMRYKYLKYEDRFHCSIKQKNYLKNLIEKS
jgi:predicted transcriptional regulator